MAQENNNSIRNGIIATVVGGIILAVIFAIWPSLLNSISGYGILIKEWISSFFLFLKESTSIPIWLLILIALVSLYSAFSFVYRLFAGITTGKGPIINKSSWHDYNRDEFNNVMWHWRYDSIGDVVGLATLCPKCKLQIYPHENVGLNYEYSVSFHCEHCGFQAYVANHSTGSQENLIIRLIQKKLRTGEWGQVVNGYEAKSP